MQYALPNEHFLGIDSACPPVLFSAHDGFILRHHYDGYHYHSFIGGGFVLSSGAELLQHSINAEHPAPRFCFLMPPLPVASGPNGLERAGVRESRQYA